MHRVSSPDADHIGGFFDVFEGETVFLSGDSKGILTFNTFLRAAREGGSDTEVVRARMRRRLGTDPGARG